MGLLDDIFHANYIVKNKFMMHCTCCCISTRAFTLQHFDAIIIALDCPNHPLILTSRTSHKIKYSPSDRSVDAIKSQLEYIIKVNTK